MTTQFKAKSISSAAIEVLGQLFVNGPTWDGNICCKSGRGELFDAGLCFRLEGFTALTPDGLRVAIEWAVPHWANKSWCKKQNGA